MADHSAPRSPRLTVVVCSYNGAAGVDRVLKALARQSIAEELDVVLVDDGSTDGTADVGRQHEVRVISHATNRGIAAARNTGLAAVATSIVAYLDDDCEPVPIWASEIRHGYEGEGVVGVGGTIEVGGYHGYMTEYLTRNNPALPLELDLASSANVVYRFGRYLARNWRRVEPGGCRRVFAFPGANMSFRAEALRLIGGFDESLTFGPEDLDVSMRLRAEFGEECLSFVPSASVVHHFAPGLSERLVKSRAYGRGHARMLAKYPDFSPTVFPLPWACLGLLALSTRYREALLVAALLPHAVHPRGLRASMRRNPSAFLDAYVSMMLEGAHDLGLIEGLSRSRARTGVTR